MHELELRAPSSAQREERSSRFTAEDESIARAGVVARIARAYPGMRTNVDRLELELASTCVAAVDGDEPTKAQAVADALDGAFTRSTGIPRGVYVWRTVEDFAQHVQLGRAARLSRERARAPRPSTSVDACTFLTPAELAAAAGDVLRGLDGAT